MPNYRRFRRKGATYFFTVNLAQSGSTLLTDEIDILRRAYGGVQKDLPFKTNAIVVLPDHLHAVWTLPAGDEDFSTRWKRIKRDFTVGTGKSFPRSQSKKRRGEAGVWQRRFWEHLVRDEADLENHLVYTWRNPVKHGLVWRSVDWPYSSIHRDIREGRLPRDGL